MDCVVLLFSIGLFHAITTLFRKQTISKEWGASMKLFQRLWIEEQGQDLVEYALLIVLVSLAAVVSMRSLARAISDAYSNATANFTSATAGL